MNNAKLYGLIGKNITHSFSRDYFLSRFAREGLDCDYRNFDLAEIGELRSILAQPRLSGLNVTIPYKAAVIPFLDALSENARQIGAVNTIEIKDGKRVGHNTDWIGFRDSIAPLLKPHHQRALILGTGGAAKAVAYALDALGIPHRLVSRQGEAGQLSYASLDREIINSHNIIINTTPVGTFPDTNEFPMIPYRFLTAKHLAYDLIYNPAETEFLKRAAQNGATMKNGLEMLQIQANKSWDIWNN